MIDYYKTLLIMENQRRVVKLITKYSMFFKLCPLLSLLLLIACTPQPQVINLTFQPTFEGSPINCNQTFTTNQTSWSLTQIQFFLHDIQFQNQQGDWHQAQILAKENADPNVVLLGGYCGESMNWQFNVEVKDMLMKKIRFSVGVPFALNHLNPLTQSSPLNQSDMFWTWQTGYKFLRMEMSSTDSEWIFHLGSTGCKSPSPVRPPKTACKNPNRPVIELDNFDGKKSIAFEIDKLIAGIDLVAHDNCQSEENNSSCQILMPRMGLGNKQQVFSVR